MAEPARKYEPDPAAGQDPFNPAPPLSPDPLAPEPLMTDLNRDAPVVDNRQYVRGTGGNGLLDRRRHRHPGGGRVLYLRAGRHRNGRAPG